VKLISIEQSNKSLQENPIGEMKRDKAWGTLYGHTKLWAWLELDAIVVT